MKKKRGLVSCIQEFKKDTILTPIFVIGEVAFDVLIPMMTGRLLTQGVEAGNMERIFYYGGIVVLMALAALLLGALSGRYAARAATGFSRNLLPGDVSECSEIFLFQHRQILHRRYHYPPDHRCDQRTDGLYDDHPHRCALSHHAYLCMGAHLYHQPQTGAGLPGGDPHPGPGPVLYYRPEPTPSLSGVQAV